MIAVCRSESSVCEAFVFGSYATGSVGPTSDLDVLVVRDTQLGIVDRVADIKFAAHSQVNVDFVVVTPSELETTFNASSFGQTVLASAKRIYAA